MVVLEINCDFSEGIPGLHINWNIRATLFQLIWYLYVVSDTDFGWCSGYLAFSVSWHAFGSKIQIQRNLESNFGEV